MVPRKNRSRFSLTLGNKTEMVNMTVVIFGCQCYDSSKINECPSPVIPNITFPPDGLVYTVNETDPVTFNCSATGIPPPEITWMRNGVVLNESVDSRISLSNPSGPETVPTPGGNISSVSRTLTISNTRDNDSDNYTCVAANGNAVTPSVTQNFELVVQGRLLVYVHSSCEFHLSLT